MGDHKDQAGKLQRCRRLGRSTEPYEQSDLTPLARAERRIAELHAMNEALQKEHDLVPKLVRFVFPGGTSVLVPLKHVLREGGIFEHLRQTDITEHIAVEDYLRNVSTLFNHPRVGNRLQKWFNTLLSAMLQQTNGIYGGIMPVLSTHKVDKLDINEQELVAIACGVIVLFLLVAGCAKTPEAVETVHCMFPERLSGRYADMILFVCGGCLRCITGYLGVQNPPEHVAVTLRQMAVEDMMLLQWCMAKLTEHGDAFMKTFEKYTANVPYGATKEDNCTVGTLRMILSCTDAFPVYTPCVQAPDATTGVTVQAKHGSYDEMFTIPATHLGVVLSPDSASHYDIGSMIEACWRSESSGVQRDETCTISFFKKVMVTLRKLFAAPFCGTMKETQTRHDDGHVSTIHKLELDWDIKKILRQKSDDRTDFVLVTLACMVAMRVKWSFFLSVMVECADDAHKAAYVLAALHLTERVSFCDVDSRFVEVPFKCLLDLPEPLGRRCQKLYDDNGVGVLRSHSRLCPRQTPHKGLSLTPTSFEGLVELEAMITNIM